MKNGATTLALMAAMLCGLGVFGAPVSASESTRTPPLAASQTRGVEPSPPKSAAAAPRTAPAKAELRGKVVRVADGDTITVLDATNTQHKIRFHGIDAPEKSQAFGNASRKHLASLVAGKDVRVETKGTDKYGRTIGIVFVDGKDVNLEMLKAGFAWHYKHFDNNPTYAQAEKDAREKKLGLWADKNPVEPYEFRKQKKSNLNIESIKGEL